MPRNRTIHNPTAKEVSAIKSRVRNLIGRDIGETTIIKDKMKEREFSFTYEIDQLRSLEIKITVRPLLSKIPGVMMHAVINPGKPP